MNDIININKVKTYSMFQLLRCGSKHFIFILLLNCSLSNTIVKSSELKYHATEWNELALAIMLKKIKTTINTVCSVFIGIDGLIGGHKKLGSWFCSHYKICNYACCNSLKNPKPILIK